jgi:hypothetical protein
MRRIVPTAHSPEFHPPATASLHPPIAVALEELSLDDPSSDEVLVPSSLLQTFADASLDAFPSSLLQTLVDESPFELTSLEVESLAVASLDVASVDVASLEELPSIVMGSSRWISTA